MIALAQAEQFAHDFSAARDLSLQLVRIVPNKDYSYEILADALLELGAYEKADAAVREMQRYGLSLIHISTNQTRYRARRPRMTCCKSTPAAPRA